MNATGTDDGSASNKPPVYADGRTLTSHLQVVDLLSIFGTIGNLLRDPYSEYEERKDGPLDGGVKAAAEATMINACARLDAMLEDASRWQVTKPEAFADAVQDAYKEQAKFFSSQTAAQKEAGTPHATYSPIIARLEPGFWVAIKGNPDNLEQCIVGAGDNPQAALESFDAVFKGEVTPQQQEWINDRFKKLYEKQALDQTGNQQTNEATPVGIDDTSSIGTDGIADAQICGEETSRVGGASEPEHGAAPGSGTEGPAGVS